MMDDQQVKITHLWAADYPTLLKEISDPPPLLWFKGDINLLSDNMLALVGSRRTTMYGKQMTETITRELVEKGIGIISGLARGIDSIAHKTALKFGGITAAVVANGVDIVYPPENTKLAEEIALAGVILSEFPLGTLPEPSFFFRRNRIVAGLSKGVIITEAGEKSGALITAAFGVEQNRELFALPGPVNSPHSRGCLKLIQEGAKLIISSNDVLDEFPAFGKTVKKQPALTLLTENEEKVFDAIGEQPVHMDKLIEVLDFGINELNNILLNLELEGYITQLSGKIFIRS